MPTDPVPASVWMRPRRTRGAQPTLSREQIVTAAVELLDASGLDGLSMRRLGEKLGAGATSLYWHVANKDELLELVADEVMGEVDVPDVAEAGWRASAAAFTRGVRAMILRHPWILGILHMQPLVGPNAMRISDRLVVTLTEAGFTGPELAHASTVLMSHAIGSGTIESAQRAFLERSGKSATEIMEEMQPYIDTLAAEYPNYHAWWLENGHDTRITDIERLREDSFAFGLERLLDGLERWLDRRGKP